MLNDIIPIMIIILVMSGIRQLNIWKYGEIQYREILRNYTLKDFILENKRLTILILFIIITLLYNITI